MSQFEEKNSGPELEQRIQDFRHSIRTLGESTESMLTTLRRGSHDASPLGSQLAEMLKLLRQLRSQLVEIAASVPQSEALNSLMESLGTLRYTVGQSLTRNASNPKALAVEATDFEMLCFSTLAAGVVWLDTLHQSGLTDFHGTDDQMLTRIFGQDSEMSKATSAFNTLSDARKN